jgi:ribonuclease P/MRP protein subunit POP1
MDAGGGSRHAGAPRTLDVQKFANARGAEVHALHAALKERRGEEGRPDAVAIPRCLRRRTTSHNRRKCFFWQRKPRRKRKRGDVEEDEAIERESARVEAEGGGLAKEPRTPCRRVRRRIELKGDEAGGGGCARDGTQRLVTHVWHAKRFTMTKAWGHWLAEGLPGR